MFVLLCADHIVLMAESEKGLQLIVNKMKLFCNDSGLQSNHTKTKVMIFENKHCTATANVNIPISNNTFNYKYLGIIFSSDMNFEEHVELTLAKARKSSYLFWNYVSRFHSLPISTIAD